MGESFVASVQYGDLKGTVSIDGHETGGPLDDLAQHTCIKPGYFPVGFGMHGLDPNKNGKHSFTLFAVKVSEVGANIEEIKAYMKEHDQLPVVGFNGELDPGTFVSYFKRFALRAHSKHLDLKPEQLTVESYDYGD